MHSGFIQQHSQCWAVQHQFIGLLMNLKGFERKQQWHNFEVIFLEGLRRIMINLRIVGVPARIQTRCLLNISQKSYCLCQLALGQSWCIFWNILSVFCQGVDESCHTYPGKCHPLCSTLKMEVVDPSKMPVPIYQTSWCYILEHNNPRSQHCQNLKSSMFLTGMFLFRKFLGITLQEKVHEEKMINF
jgi:hypothetical protein